MLKKKKNMLKDVMCLYNLEDGEEVRGAVPPFYFFLPSSRGWVGVLHGWTLGVKG